jgi:hypothetical protein
MNKTDEIQKSLNTFVMTEIQDHGDLKHLRFEGPEFSGRSYFTITIWAGRVCISGFMSTFVFQIPQQDLEAIASGDLGGVHLDCVNVVLGDPFKYSEELFKEAVMADFGSWNFNCEKERQRALEDVEMSVLKMCAVESEAMAAVENFRSAEGHEFVDFWRHCFVAPSHNYQWCLEALVWGMKEYCEELDKKGHGR